jgi:6-pyruvoyltetrahydropterin/6-carboxytetrahydropterin synthase
MKTVMKKRIVCKEYKWEAAHRLLNYPHNCRNLHGHSYRATICMRLEKEANLNEFGFVCDFNHMKKMKAWIDENLDHACLVSKDDQELLDFLASQEGRNKHFIVPGQSSAENIAELLFHAGCRLLDTERVKVVRVTVNETCTSEAIFQKESL